VNSVLTRAGSEIESAFLTDVESSMHVAMERQHSHVDTVWGFAESFLPSATTTATTTTTNGNYINNEGEIYVMNGGNDKRDSGEQEVGEKKKLI
jgi:hypothetical protein